MSSDQVVAGDVPREPADAYPPDEAAVQLALAAVRTADRAGLYAGVLEVTAVLSADGVRRDLLHAAGQTGVLVRGRRVPAGEVDQVLAQLADRSLLSMSQDGPTVIMPGPVARVVRAGLVRTERLTAVCWAAASMLGARANALAESPDRTEIRDIPGQVTALQENARPAAEADERLAGVLLRLRFWVLYQLIELGDSAPQAIEVGELLTTELERVLGPDHPDTLNARNSLAAAYQAARRTADAIPLFQHTLVARQRVLGPNHPDTLTSKNNLAATYQDAGRYAEAILLFRLTLAARERLLGTDHPSTLNSRGNLAAAYRATGRVSEAIPLLEQTLAGRERVLWAGHPDVQAARDNLAAAQQETDWNDQQPPPAPPPADLPPDPLPEPPAAPAAEEPPSAAPAAETIDDPAPEAAPVPEPEPEPEAPEGVSEPAPPPAEEPPAATVAEEPLVAAPAAETDDDPSPGSAPAPEPEPDPKTPADVSGPEEPATAVAEESAIATVRPFSGGRSWVMGFSARFRPKSPRNRSTPRMPIGSSAAPAAKEPPAATVDEEPPVAASAAETDDDLSPGPAPAPEPEPEPATPEDVSGPEEPAAAVAEAPPAAPAAEEPEAPEGVSEPAPPPAEEPSDVPAAEELPAATVDEEPPAAAPTAETDDDLSPELAPAPEPEPEPQTPEDVFGPEPPPAAVAEEPPAEEPPAEEPPAEEPAAETDDDLPPGSAPTPEPEPEPETPEDVSEPEVSPAEPPPAAPAAEEPPAAPVAEPPAVPVAESPAPSRDRPARRRRRVPSLVAAIVVLLAAGGVAVALSGSHGGHSGHRPATASRGAGSQPLSAASQLAAAWVAQQVVPSAIVACDPLMCSALEAQGVPAANLLVLRADTTSPLSAQVVVVTPAVRSQFGSRLDSVYAPSVIAGFGSGPDQVSVQVVAKDGPTAYLTALRQDAADRKTAGAQLLANKHIQASAEARAQLAAGAVDSRLLIMLPALAAVHPIQVLAFGDPAPGAGPGVPLCSADLSGSGQAASMSDVSYLRWLTSFVGTQLVPFTGSMSVLQEADQPIVRVVFAQPSPLGLLSHT